MHPQQDTNSDLKTRLFYGGVVGAVVGMIIGTMPANDPRVAIIAMAFSALLVSALAGPRPEPRQDYVDRRSVTRVVPSKG